jgi:hypothetical protein
MLYPEELYYAQTKTGARYTTTPTANPDFDKAIRNEAACFIDISTSIEKKPKKIIFSDWTYSNLDLPKKAALRPCFDALISHGFELYFWYSGELVQYTKDNWDKLKVSYSPLEDPKKIRASVIKQKKQCTEDNIFLLDDYWLERLLNPHNLQIKRKLRLKNLTSLGNADIQRRLAIINKFRPKLEEILVDEFSVKAAQALGFLKELVPDCIITPAIEKITLTLPPSSDTYHILKPFMEKEHIGHVKRIEIKESAYINIDYLVTLLRMSPYIEYLNLYECKNLSADITSLPEWAQVGELTHLKKLDVNSTNISPETLLALIKKAPNLKDLCFFNVGRDEPHSFELLCNTKLPKLKKLLAANSDIRSAQITAFLEKNPHIKFLDLGSTDSANSFAALHPQTLLAKLNTVHAMQSTIQAADVKALLEKAPHLKTLDLIQCKEIEGAFSSLAANTLLPALEGLSASRSNLSSEDIQALLLKASNLETLYLNSCKNISQSLIQLPLNTSLPKLKKIYLYSSDINVKTLIILLKIASNIEELGLDQCNIAGFAEYLSNKQLANLKIINLTNSTITAYDLKTILEQAPALEELNFRECKNIGGYTTLLSHNTFLPTLKKIDASKSNITAKDMQVLFKQAAHLERLYLNECQNLGEDWIPSYGLLAKLKSISLSKSDVTLSNLLGLLSIAPQLEELDLHNCMALDSEIEFSLNTPLARLKKLSAYASNISSRMLHSVLINAPHLGSLDLSNCENIGGAFSMLPPKTLLPALKTLALYGSNVTLEEVMTLLEVANNLEELDIHNCFDLNDFIDDLNPNVRLLKLTELILSNDLDELDEVRLAKLRTIAPNLNFEKLTGRKSPNESKSSGDAISLKRNGATSKSVDAETEFNPKKKFKLTRIFYSTDGAEHPEISTYRMECYDAIQLNQNVCPASQAFALYHQNNDLKLINRRPPRLDNNEFQQFPAMNTAHHSLISGKQKFYLDNQWQAIASLSAAEEMMGFNTNPIDAHIELRYSTRDNLYYIRSTAGNQCIDFKFLTKVPRQSPALPPKIQAMVNDFSNYGSGELELKEPYHSIGKDYLDAILKERKGACRHRAVAFMAEMLKKFPGIPLRIIHNDCHAFVEVYIKDQWIRCNLGGYPAKLEILEATEGGVVQIKREGLSSIGTTRALGLNHLLTTALFNKYDKIMETWSKELMLQDNLKAFQRSLLQPNPRIKKTLLELNCNEAVNAMLLSVQKHCMRIKRPVFYVHSPSDVMCKADYLKKEGNVGTIIPGPGGALHDFLTAPYTKDKPPVLLINYANFSPSELVGLNALLDKERRADGIAVPEDALIIGAINTEAPDVYEGSDFYSRFDKRYVQPISETAVHDFLNQYRIHEKQTQDRTFVINLYHAPDWKSQLLGRWTMTQEGFRFEEGLLKTAIASGRTIEIQNGLWEDPEFNLFWQHALHLGQIRQNGETIHTQGIHLVKSSGYNWDLLKKNGRFQTTLRPNLQSPTQSREAVLNPSNLGEFFATYNFQKSKKSLVKGEGLIEKAHKEGKTTLCVHLTRTLSEDDWARLLNHCRKHRMTLEVKTMPGAVLPQALQEFESEYKSDPATKVNPQVQIIQSTDPDSTISMLKAENPKRIVIDVSECKPTDLLIKTRPHYNKKKLKLEFTQQKRALIKALEKSQHLVLTGTISNELADALAPVVLAMQDNPKSSGGTLSIVSKNIDNLRYASCFVDPQLRPGACPRDLMKRAPLLDPADKPRDVAAESKPDVSAQKKRGLVHLDYDPRCLGQFTPDTSKEETESFNAYRNQLILAVLNHSPYVFIAGLSGVGKSTFVEKEFMKGVPHKLYRGEHSLEQWALDKSDSPKFLFIEEANLSPRQWSEMEGLFYNKPPLILINGELRSLSPQHKIIFAGNPVNYGDERTLAPFFERHGRAVVFDPLPLAVIFEQILKPVFEHTALSTQAATLCKPIFDVYSFLCAQSTTEILISPRELQMMALLTLSYCRQNINICPNSVAQYYAHTLAKPLVPADKLPLFEQLFGKDAPVIVPLPLPIEAINNPGFTATPSRLPALNRLHELLVLRDMRHLASNEAQKSGGLGGLILEGDSSVGKSAMVLALLRAHGFEEVHNLNAPAHQVNPFYRMDVNSATEEKEKLLIKAFYEGAVVVVDEINSSPMMERLLNDLLMGKLPDKYKKPHKEIKAGFMIIGTQNPVTMAGRRACSTALSRRLCFLELPPYPREELLHIIIGTQRYPKAALDEFELIIDAFMRKSAEAKYHGYMPAPTLRQVLQETELIKHRHPALRMSLSALPHKLLATVWNTTLNTALFFKNYDITKAIPEGLTKSPPF